MGSPVSLPAGFELDELPQGFELDRSAPAASESVIKPAPEAHGFGEHIARWADNVSHDLKYGTDLTGVGAVLKKMGAHGLDVGNSEKVGEFMGSLPLGLLRMVKGHGEMASDQPLQGVKDIAGGALQAAEMPSMIVGPPSAPAAVEMAAGALTKGARAASELMPSAARAGQKFEKVMNAAGDMPIDLTKASEPVMRALELERAGAGAPPSVITKMAERIPQHGGAPMMFREARDFYTNAGRLSASEALAAKPQMAAQVSKLAKYLAEANEEAASKAGVEDIYLDAMKEYRNAMKLKDFKDKSFEYAKKAAVGAIFGAAGWEIGKHFL